MQLATQDYPENVIDAPAPLVAAEPAQPNPLAGLVRAMRGRWKAAIAASALLGGLGVTLGYLGGVQLYESQAILRVFPQESNILYATGEDSVLKTFDSFVKAETSYVASPPVMARGAAALAVTRPDIAAELQATDLSRSIEIRRSDSLIVLKTRSADTQFARQKLEAVITAYLSLTAEGEEARTAVRLSELRAREGELATRLTQLRANQLETGGEFGLNALAKAHVEKIAQIDGLAARRSEVAATLASLRSNDGPSSADTSDQEIMRATLLDRAMADLNFERAKLMSELAGLRSGYTEQTNVRFQRKEEAKLKEIAVIERAMDARREQIRVLGQTGALTDVADGSDDTTVAEIESLLEKVTNQLATARTEARDLNRRRIDLDRIENEIEEAEGLLEETRRALEVIHLEFGRALPGYAVVMSPPSQPVDPAEDTRKMLMAGGLAGGWGLALALILTLGLVEKRVRYAESLLPVEDRLPVVQVSDATDQDAHSADLLRNELQLHSLKRPRLVGQAPIIAVTRAAGGDTNAFARALAESFARAQLDTLFIDADLAQAPEPRAREGWRDLLTGASALPIPSTCNQPLWTLGAGQDPRVADRAVSAPMVRTALAAAAEPFDVVIVATGGLGDRLSAQLLLAEADVGVLALTPQDTRADLLAQADRLGSLPRNGSVAVMRHALSNDPWLAVRT